MPQDNAQKFHARNRPPRVQIEYEVYTGGAMKLVEIPFVMGVLADLTGARTEESRGKLKGLREREFLDIDAEKFDSVLASQMPRVAFDVENLIGEGGDKLKVELKFQKLQDFRPDRVAENVPALARLLAARQSLQELLGRMDGKEQAEVEVAKLLSDPELQKLMGTAPPATEATEKAG